jgi:hypothetical protein
LVTVNLNPGVIVNSPGGGAVNLVTLSNGAPTANGDSTTINANGTAASPIVIDNTANPGGSSNWGLVDQPGSGGDAVINAMNTQISVKGTGGDAGIWAISYSLSPSSVASVTWSGPSITSSGANSTGIQAENRGSGNASIDASGNIFGSVGTPGGSSFLGLDALAGSSLGNGEGGGAGSASVLYHRGMIDVGSGNFNAGIFASAPGSATITTLSGTNIVVGLPSSTDIGQVGIDAFSDSAAATDTVASTITINGNPATPTTNYKFNPTAIRAQSDSSGDASVTYTGPGITVHGGAASASLP